MSQSVTCECDLQLPETVYQIWSVFPSRFRISAHSSGQVLARQGQSCSLFRAFTSLPPGTLAVTDFADSLGLDFNNTFKNWIKPDRHLGGDRFEVTSIAHPTRKNYSEKYFTPEQQKKALDILRRHGRLPVSNKTEE